MKLKLIGLAALTVIIYSCGSKSAVASTPPAPPAAPSTEVAAVPATEPKSAIVMTAALAAGKTAYDNNCVKCHRLYEAKEYSKEEWGPILLRMQKKAHLTDAEMAPITNYIYTQL